jgi:lysophospholipase L1-like esterase
VRGLNGPPFVARGRARPRASTHTAPSDRTGPSTDIGERSARDAPRLRLLQRARAVSRQVPSYRTEWDVHNEEALRRGGCTWVVLGDSLSQGIGASDWDQGWVQRSSTQLTASGYDELQILNLSRSGATTRDVIDRQLPELRLHQAAGLTPTLCSLVIGANDMMRAHRRQGLESRFSAILAALPTGAVVTYLPQPVAVARRVNALIDRAASEGLVQPVSIRQPALLWPRNSAADLFHPNDLGYQLLADRMTPALMHALDLRR